MSDLIPSRRSGRSPFDAIRNVEEDGTEWWSSREMMSLLGYERWESFLDVLDRAKAACRNNGHQPNDHFRRAPKKVGLGSGARREIVDFQLSRYGAYLVAMNGDPRKPEIAAAQQYFAVQTYRAETELPIAVPSVPQPAALTRPWSERLDRTIVAHRRHIIQHCPAGWWSIYTATIPEILILEGEFLRHYLPAKRSDLPDGSIGKRWAAFREEKSWAGVVVRTNAPLVMPHLRGMDGDPLVVYPRIYGPTEREFFENWLNSIYLPAHLPQYLGDKFPRKTYGLTPASTADNTCRQLTGRPAVLPQPVRQQLSAAGGFIPYTRQITQEPGPDELF